MSLSAEAGGRPSLMFWLVLIAAGVAWGGTQVLGKIAVSTGQPSVGLVLWQTVIGVALLAGVMAATRTRLPLGRWHLGFYATCAVLGTVLPHTLSLTAIRHIPVGIATIMIETVPMMTLVFAAILKIERLEARRVLGILLGGAAAVLLVAPEASLPEPGQGAWAALLLVVALSYAGENIVIARYQPPDTDPLQTMMGLTLGALILLVPMAAVSDGWAELSAMGRAEQALIASSVLHVLSYLALVWLITRAGPVFASQIGYVVTLSGVFLGIAVLGERHSEWVWLALVLMLGGLSLVAPRAPR